MKRSNYRPKHPVQTLEKALDVLLYIGNNPSFNGVTISKISESTGINKSGVHRILDTYLSYRIVEKIKSSQTYRLGWGLYEMGLAVPSSCNLLSINYVETMSKLCSQFSETINIGICSDDEVVNFYKCEPESKLHASVTVGGREPMYASALGKVFLSELNEEEIREFYDTYTIVKMTDNTIMTAEAMIAELAKARRVGYTMDHAEAVKDLTCMAMPIRDYTGNAVAALSISGPTPRMTCEKVEQILPEFSRAVQEFSNLLGYAEV